MRPINLIKYTKNYPKVRISAIRCKKKKISWSFIKRYRIFACVVFLLYRFGYAYHIPEEKRFNTCHRKMQTYDVELGIVKQWKCCYYISLYKNKQFAVAQLSYQHICLCLSKLYHDLCVIGTSIYIPDAHRTLWPVQTFRIVVATNIQSSKSFKYASDGNDDFSTSQYSNFKTATGLQWQHFY